MRKQILLTLTTLLSCWTFGVTRGVPNLAPKPMVWFSYEDSIKVGGKYIFGCEVITISQEEYNPDSLYQYYDILTAASGIDSVVALTLTPYILPCEPVEFAYTDSVAEGKKYIFGCEELTQAGEYRDTIVKADGCDSIVVLTLTTYTPPVPPCEEVTFAYTDSISIGGQYIFGCQVLTEKGEYKDTLTTATGCDSIVILTLTEYTPVPPCEEVTFEYTDSIAIGGKYIFGCQVLTEKGEYRDTIVKADGCDSIVILTLTEYTPVPPCEEVTFEYTDSIAIGGQYIFGCQVLTEKGEYRDTIVKADGCDSIVILTLTEYTPVPPCEEVTFAYTDSIAVGGKYIFGCQVLTEKGEYRDTIVKADGCDSIVILTLTEYTPVPPCEEVTFEYTDSIAVGGQYIFGCQVLTEKGEYRDTIVKADGCDSIVILTLTEYLQCEPVEYAYTDSIARGGTYLFNCQVLTEAGEYRDTIVKADGCDSIVVLTLTEYLQCEPVEYAYTDSIARGGTYLFNCQVLTEAGEYRDTIVKADGCDSIVILTLTEYTPVPPCEEVTFEYTDSIAVGGQYIFGCQVLTEKGEYRDTIVKADGCDSIVILTLTEYTPYIPPVVVHDTVMVDSIDAFCRGTVFVSRSQIITLNQDTVWRDTIPNIEISETLIRDSIYQYTMTVLLPTTGDTTVTICQGETFTWHGQAGVDGATWTTTNIAGCDSVVTLHVIELLPTTGDTTATICQGETFTWHGQAGVDGATWTTTNIAGCDSVVTLHVIELLPTTGDTTATICQGETFTWHGQAGVDGATWTTTNAAGCDSVVTLHVTVLLPTTGDTTATICQGETFTWHGQTGVDGATWTTTNVAGCDSVVTLHVTVLQPTTGDTTATICQGETFTWHGAEGVEGSTWTTTNAAGCDSVVTLHINYLSRYTDELPALVKDDSWLLMIHRRSINEDWHIDFTAEQVHWYRVVGEVDEYPYGEDNDIFVGTGDYYTIDKKIHGRYYAILKDVDWQAYGPCIEYGRTVVLNCDQPKAQGPQLSPTIVPAGGSMTLSNLYEGETQITVFNAAGQRLREKKMSGQTQYELQADGVTGVYMLQVVNGAQKKVFKYVVTQ